ncbi:MAG: ParB/RepB/Spo0J family partition protein [Actinomycetales bacterium]|nr:ParB/RepB/Spo0J family partition protein [Actinomycetales bacterium]
MSVDAPGRYAELPISAINPNPRQPRDVFDPEALAELVHSIKEIGLLQPVVVRPVGEGRYELVAGERRLRASTAARMTAIPAIIRETADADLLRDALLENLHRADLNAIEEAAAYQQLLEDFGCTQEELATRIGRSRPQVTNTLRLLKLPAPVQKRVAAGILSAGHAKALAGVSDAAACEALAVKVVAQGLSVRALEELLAVGVVGASTRKKSRTAKRTTTDFPEVTEQLADALHTRVSIHKPKGIKPGIIAIEFADAEDLARVAAHFRG